MNNIDDEEDRAVAEWLIAAVRIALVMAWVVGCTLLGTAADERFKATHGGKSIQQFLNEGL